MTVSFRQTRLSNDCWSQVFSFLDGRSLFICHRLNKEIRLVFTDNFFQKIIFRDSLFMPRSYKLLSSREILKQMYGPKEELVKEIEKDIPINRAGKKSVVLPSNANIFTIKLLLGERLLALDTIILSMELSGMGCMNDLLDSFGEESDSFHALDREKRVLEDLNRKVAEECSLLSTIKTTSLAIHSLRSTSRRKICSIL